MTLPQHTCSASVGLTKVVWPDQKPQHLWPRGSSVGACEWPRAPGAVRRAERWSRVTGQAQASRDGGCVLHWHCKRCAARLGHAARRATRGCGASGGAQACAGRRCRPTAGGVPAWWCGGGRRSDARARLCRDWPAGAAAAGCESAASARPRTRDVVCGLDATWWHDGLYWGQRGSAIGGKDEHVVM